MIEFQKLVRLFFSGFNRERNVFFLYSLSYAFLALIIPFFVQLIVNQLALAGLKQTLVTLIFLVGLGLAGYYLLRFAQFILLEYVQRKLKVDFLQFFLKDPPLQKKDKWYYFEINSVQKKIGNWALEGFDILLGVSVGLLALAFYHPLFLFLSIYLLMVLWIACFLGKEGLQTSIAESDLKYKIYEDIDKDSKVSTDIKGYFLAREKHFEILRKQTILVLVSQWVGQLIVLFGGLYLVETHQLALGQFVAAEIIATNLFITLNKAPKFFENHFDLLTSLFKLSKVSGTKDESSY
jgi:hypothetical protein